LESSSDLNWQTVGFIEGNGTSNVAHNYSYTDANLTSGSYAYRLKQIDNDGSTEYSQIIEQEIKVIPSVFYLGQNYPNPFNPSTIIAYQLPVGSNVTLKVYDILGKEIATLVNETKEAGSFEVKFDASKLSNGLYLYTLHAGNFTATKKLLLMK
jgi:hypothetical protein